MHNWHPCWTADSGWEGQCIKRENKSQRTAVVDASFQQGYMRKKRATSDIIAWDYSPEKACVVWRVAVIHQTQSLIFLFLLYQNHSDCSECKLSAMWIKIVKSFSFLPFFNGERSYVFYPFFPLLKHNQ